MALVKITDLTALASGSSQFSSDVLPIVDVSADTTFKMTLNNLKGALGLRSIEGDNNGGYVTGSLTVSGSVKTNFISASATYNATTADHMIEFTGSSNVTCNLYSVVGNEGRQIIIKNSNTGIVTVDAHSTEIIDGQLTRTLSENEALFLICDGINEWHVINNAPTPIIMGHETIDPADGATYFIGQFLTQAPAIASGATRRAEALKSGYITVVTAMISVAGTTGTSDDSTFIIRNVTTSTSNTISTTVKHNTAAQLNFYKLTVPLQVTRGDEIEIRWTAPTWGTNPTAVRQVFNVLIE